jgi:hypothetical protein
MYSSCWLGVGACLCVATQVTHRADEAGLEAKHGAMQTGDKMQEHGQYATQKGGEAVSGAWYSWQLLLLLC